MAAVFFGSLVIIALFSWIAWWLVSDDENTCIRPSDPEYNLTNVTESLSKDGFSITGVECATGFTGTPIATACSVAGQPYTLSGCSADSTNSPCSLSTLTQPTNGSWGTICPSNSGEIQHGASCDLGCNTGYTPSNQPTCNNGVFSSTTLTCTAAAVQAGEISGNTNPRTCGDTDADGSPNDFDCRGETNGLVSDPAGITCQADHCLATECCTVTPATEVEFSLSNRNQSCEDHCASITVGGQTKQCLNETEGAAYQFRNPMEHTDILPHQCESWFNYELAPGRTQYPYLYSDEAGLCYYSSLTGIGGFASLCDSYHTHHRICKCGIFE